MDIDQDVNQLYVECLYIMEVVHQRVRRCFVELHNVVHRLRLVAAKLRAISRNTCAARVACSSLGAVGSLTVVVGLTASVISGGLAAPITVGITGAIVGASGAAASGLSQIVQQMLFSRELRTANASIENVNMFIRETRSLLTELSAACTYFRHPCLSPTGIMMFFLFGLRSSLPNYDAFLSKHFTFEKCPEKVKAALSTFMTLLGSDICDHTDDDSLFVNNADATFVAGAAGATAAKLGLSAGAGGVAIVSAFALSGLSMALDFIDLIKGVEAMAKDSRERASEELLSIATDIEHKTDCLRQSLALIRSFYYE